MSLAVVRERPSRRRAYGINAPLFVSVAGGGRVRAREWSHLGIVLSEDALPPLDGGLVHLSLHLNFQGYDIAVPARAKLDLSGDSPTPEGCRRLEFVDLPQRSAQLIEHFVEDYVRGRLTEASDTLVRIDSPAEPISTKPDPPKPGQPEPRFSLRPYLTTAFYLALGLGVFAYIGLLLYANAVRMEVHTAVVTRPIEVVQMPTDGVLSDMLVEEGDHVLPGSVVARVGDPDLVARREDARATLAEARSKAALARQRLALETDRLDDLRLVNRTERREALARVEGRREEVRTLTARLKSLRSLSARGFAPSNRVADAEAAKALARSRLRAAELAAERLARMDEVSERRHHNGNEFVVDLDLLKLEIAEADAEAEKLAGRLAALEALEEKRDVHAGPGGRVIETMAVRGQQLVRLTPLAVVEEDVPAIVEAYLNQEEVQEIGFEDTASVFLPATEERFEARIVEIDRTGGFVDEQRAQYVWRGPKDRSARVILQPIEPGLADALTSGLPATVLFRRQDVSAMTSIVANELFDLGRRVGLTDAVGNSSADAE